LGVYTFDALGNLQFVRAVPNSGQAICWVRTNAAGTYLYTVNTMDSSISVYDNSNPLTPVEIQHFKLKGVGNPFQPTIDSRGHYLYVLTQRAATAIPLGQGNTLHTLKIQPNGMLTEDQSPVQLPVPAGVRPQGVASIEIP
jgi:6-phosphogluconolactonase (cycloisomerase 2 family)